MNLLSSARGRFEKGGIDIGEVLDGKYTLGRVCAVLCEATIHGNAMGLEVFAEKLFTTTAIKAFSAEFRVVSDHAVTDFETLHLRSNGRNDTDSFMARDQGELALLSGRPSESVGLFSVPLPGIRPHEYANLSRKRHRPLLSAVSQYQRLFFLHPAHDTRTY